MGVKSHRLQLSDAQESAEGRRLCGCGAVMDEVGSPARRRCGPAGLSAVQSDTIEGLTELEDLERVYAQLCAEEVNVY